MKERVCKNCALYNKKEGVCSVVVIMQEEKYELPVNPNDSCHWERTSKEIDNSLENAIKDAPHRYFREKLITERDQPIEIQQIRVWSDGQNGYIEYPEHRICDL